jgi:tetratricopeptide (TPR) repeat protein
MRRKFDNYVQDGTIDAMFKLPNPKTIAILGLALALLTMAAFQYPPIQQRAALRLDLARTYLRGVIYPAGPVPTPLAYPSDTPAPPTPTPTTQPSPTPTQPGPTATPIPTPTPIPASVSLEPPLWEKQDINNCGPASLALYLRYYGWEGDQFTISDLLKPLREDRNVNVEELVYYVRTRAGWLNAEFRVGGDLELLKQFVAAGIPVLIEESFDVETPYWPNDDLWAAHYYLVTGYDDASRTFTGQDSYHGPDQAISYDTLDEQWKIFNRVYILVYPPAQEETVKSILGDHWDVRTNRQHALDIAQAEIDADPEDAFAWFNLGTNLVYFESYTEAANAYDQARNLGLPQRMLRYQFGPFFAYFHTFRTDDLLALTEYALQRTPNSEEALLWRGWGRYRAGDRAGALQDFNAALEANPYYQDAQYAINFVSANP